MTETDRIVNVVLSRYEAQLLPPTKDYPFATLETEQELTWKESLFIWGALFVGCSLFALMLIGIATVIRWCL